MRRPRRFALGLLVYLLLTVATFALVYRYAVRIAALYGYDIKQKWLQFGLYFLIYFAFAVAACLSLQLLASIYARASRLDRRPSTETILRLAFLAALTLNTIVALYQRRFGNMVGANYFLVGALGSYAGVLEMTRRRFGLVETISQPSAELRAAVEAAHAGITVVRTTWDTVKRWLELVVALVVIVVSLPISLPLAVLTWLSDPGPLLVAKVAVKQGGRSFRQFKLRTMVKKAEELTGPVPAAPEDERVTPIGLLLRRTHIDELSQMINIALGDMSLVGPRPERTVFVARHLAAIPGYAQRHSVPPGLAGLAQVYGDYYSTPQQKLRYDLLYVRRRGPGLDARLLAAAVLMALFGIQPRRRGRRRRPSQATVERWRRAYEALRGERPPVSPTVVGPANRTPTPRPFGPGTRSIAERHASPSIPGDPADETAAAPLEAES